MEDDVFSLHLIEEVNWEGSAVKFIGTFRSVSDALEGFSTWIGHVRKGWSKEAILSDLMYLTEVDDVNDVLERYKAEFDSDRVRIEIKKHKLGDVLLPTSE
jgi:hypothetical protein